MTANPRRSGFRLPWVSESDEQQGEAGAAAEREHVARGEIAAPTPDAATTNGSDPRLAGHDRPASANGAAPVATDPSHHGAEAEPVPAAAPTPTAPTPTAPAESSSEFLRELVAAMRKVADETRMASVERLRADAEDTVRALESDAERRRRELRERAEADVVGIGEWARAEAERIKAEAEQRVTARRAQLEEQLAAAGTRTEAEAQALRKRVEDYEWELEAFHAQLNEINDPAAFAAAAKRMPPPPELMPHRAAVRSAAPAASPPPTVSVPAAPAPITSAPGASTFASGAPAADPAEPVHPAEEEVLSARLADLDATLADAPPTPTGEPPADAAVDAEGSTTTDIVVKGLGSFGAITGFRQSLAGQPGIAGVALSLGQSGEFVFRATHAPGFDIAAAIVAMEGDAASVEPRPEGGVRVTLDRPR